eukprot:366120-Chlamydomonas_euryale.AAC.1
MAAAGHGDPAFEAKLLAAAQPKLRQFNPQVGFSLWGRHISEADGAAEAATMQDFYGLGGLTEFCFGKGCGSSCGTA